MKKILLFAFFALLASFMDAQTFTFECYCGDLSGVRCDICTGQTQTRFFCGLLIKKSGTVVKWIDAPYIIQWQGNNAIIKEIIPNPETFTINLSGTSFANLAAFKAALECPCNVPGKLFYISDSTKFAKVMRGDTVTIVGNGGATVTLDTTNQKFIVTAAAGSAQVLSATGVGPTQYNIALSGGGGAIVLKEGASINLTRTADTITIANTSPDQTVVISGAGINVVTGTYPNFTITGTEIDGNTANEGLLGVGAGSGTSSVLLSNTSGATGVTINAAGINSISETTSANGGQITITATEVDGSTTNELQTIANTSTSTTHTATLSNSGGSIQLAEGANITLTTTGTGLDGIITIATTGLGNGIYGGSGTVPWNVVPTITNTITFTATDTAGGKVPFNIVSTGNDPEIQKWVGNAGSVILGQSDVDYYISSDKVFGLTSTEYTYMQGDSVAFNTIEATPSFPAVVGINSLGTLKQIVGTSNGQALVWNSGKWAPGTAGGGGVTGSGTANYVTYWNGGSTITGSSNFQFDGTRVGIGGAPLAGFGLYSTTATRVDGTGVFRGTGSLTASTSSPHVRLWNTTASTGDTWYVGSENNGSFDIISSNLGDTLLSINSTGALAYYTTPNSSVSLRIGNNKPLGIPLGVTANRNTTKIPGLWSNTSLRVIEGKIDSSTSVFKTILAYGSPTTTKQVGMGSTGTVKKAFSSNDKAGQLTLVVSGTGIAAGSLVNVAYVGTYASVPFVSLTARNAAAAGQSTNFFIGTQTTSNFTINVNTALAAGTYILNYQTQQ